MASAPDRGVFTDWLLTHLGTTFLVGDIEAPAGAGWQTESAAAGSEFIPYVTLMPGTSSQSSGSFGDPSMDWKLSYTLNNYGVNRRQVEDLADDIRAILLAVKKVSVTMKDGSTVWRLNTIACTSIGGVGHTNAVSPTAFSQTDSITLTVSRSL